MKIVSFFLLLSLFLVLTKGDDIQLGPSDATPLTRFSLREKERAQENARSDYPEVFIDPDCGEDSNLGYGFSEAIGDNYYSSACYPEITGFPGAQNGYPGWPYHGYDDGIAVFVGGDFLAVVGAEVEGNLVVLGDLTVQSSGAGNFVSVGAGTHVLPNNGGDCIIVGGDLEAQRDIQVFNMRATMYCDIVYRGTGTNVWRWKTNGSIRNEPDYDMSEFETLKSVFDNKSDYWGTLEPNALVHEQWTTTTFYCNLSSDNIQIFSINKGDSEITSATSYKFSSDCAGKTILINVMGEGDVAVNAAAMYDTSGSQSFSSCDTESILWNFPEATNVDIGNGWTSEFRGSILVRGNLDFTTTGHSGRTIVLGDLTHNRGGSEFHSYQFKPPYALPCEPTEITGPHDSEMTFG